MPQTIAASASAQRAGHIGPDPARAHAQTHTRTHTRAHGTQRSTIACQILPQPKRSRDHTVVGTAEGGVGDLCDSSVVRLTAAAAAAAAGPWFVAEVLWRPKEEDRKVRHCLEEGGLRKHKAKAVPCRGPQDKGTVLEKEGCGSSAPSDRFSAVLKPYGAPANTPHTTPSLISVATLCC